MCLANIGLIDVCPKDISAKYFFVNRHLPYTLFPYRHLAKMIWPTDIQLNYQTIDILHTEICLTNFWSPGIWPQGICPIGICPIGIWPTGSWTTGSWVTGSWPTSSWPTGSWPQVFGPQGVSPQTFAQ
jgi:hypothetical protein